MSTTESHLWEISSAIGAGIDDGRSQSLLSPKRKLAETEDGAAVKRNRGDVTEEQKPLGKQQVGGCECKGGECECEGESEEDMSMEEEIGVGTLGSGSARDEDSSDDELGRWGNMLDDPEIAKIWCQPDPVMCCPYPFTDLEFKQDTELYNDLKAFCVNAVDYLNARYKEAARFQDIEKVTSCHAPCKHSIVTLKSKDPTGQAWKSVLRGRLPPQGFAEAKPREFYMLVHCRV